MSAIPVEVRRVVREQPDLQVDLDRARRMANWLDARFSVFGVRFGMDAVIGLIPGIGDTLTALASSYLLYIANRHKLGKVVQTRMTLNILIDWLPGMIPVVGDVFDAAYKANLKNLALLEAAAARKRCRS